MTKLLNLANFPLETSRNAFYPPHESEHLPAHGKPSFGFWGARNVEILNYSRRWQSRPSYWFCWNDLALRLIQKRDTVDDHYMVVRKRIVDLHAEFEELKAELSYFSSTRLFLLLREQILSYFVPAWDTYGLMKTLSELKIDEH